MRYAASKRHCIIGTTVFPRPTGNDRENNLGQGRDIWYGYTQSARPVSGSWGGIAVNVDAKTSAFYRGCSFLEFASEVFTTPQNRLEQGLDAGNAGHANNIKILEKHLKGYLFKECFYRNITCSKSRLLSEIILISYKRRITMRLNMSCIA